ncbi:MAG: triose-phosphate isomerase [Candidatus Nomurabacteria bacterium]|nr:triose-phosphate isomerase [Candidatus Nomurabacteria bacterium]
MNKKIIIANWKMNPLSAKEAIKIAKGTDLKGVILCAPTIYLKVIKKVIKKAKLGSQNVSVENPLSGVGAFTGEVSAKMLYDIGSRYTIVGHSERRAMGETNQIINKKIKVLIDTAITPVLCIGEIERDENHEYLNIVKHQIEECLFGLNKNLLSKIIIAYEPVWAIGKNALREATPAEFLEMKIFTKKVLVNIFGDKVEMPAMLYGGSVDEKNTRWFAIDGGADGFLVGRASLDPKKFKEIVKICETLNK